MDLLLLLIGFYFGYKLIDWTLKVAKKLDRIQKGKSLIP